MIRVGIVGLGFMGRMHYRCWKPLKNVSITAVCDSNPQAFSTSNASKGNIAGDSDSIDFSGLKTFSNYSDLLSAGVTDALSITLPSHMHGAFTVKALNAGLHVLCEKPMALTLKSCDNMIETARRNRRILQIAHCIRFWPEYVAAKDIISSGKYGKVISATFQRFSPMPAWSAKGWLANTATSGGVPLDLHIRDSDFIQHLFGMPDSALSVANKQMTYMHTTYLYKNGPAVTAEGSWCMAPKFGFKMSFLITLEKATLTYDCTSKPAFMVYPSDGDAFTPEVSRGDGYSIEIEYFSKKISGKKVKDVLTLKQSRDTVKLVLLEKKSAETQKSVKVK